MALVLTLHLPFTPKSPPFPIPNRLSISCSTSSVAAPSPSTPPVAIKKKRDRKRYRKPCPGEAEGIVQEMRFVAMKLRNEKGEKGGDDGGETWEASLEGYLRYLVDSKVVFETIERIVDESTDVAYVYFRKTGLERSARLSEDLEWFSQQGNAIPEPSSPGTTYANYLKELAGKSIPSFLCHFYNIYSAHISGGQEIGKKICNKLLEGRELEFYKWDKDAQELLKDVRINLNKLGEHWSRDEKNRCLSEAAKSFRYLGHIVRLIIL